MESMRGAEPRCTPLPHRRTRAVSGFFFSLEVIQLLFTPTDQLLFLKHVLNGPLCLPAADPNVKSGPRSEHRVSNRLVLYKCCRTISTLSRLVSSACECGTRSRWQHPPAAGVRGQDRFERQPRPLASRPCQERRSRQLCGPAASGAGQRRGSTSRDFFQPEGSRLRL